MLLLGTDPKESFRLSFLALIPASLGATLVTILFSKTSLSASIGGISTEEIIVALVVTFLVGSVMIRWLLRVAAHERITTLVFALGVFAIIGGLLGYDFRRLPRNQPGVSGPPLRNVFYSDVLSLRRRAGGLAWS